MAAKEPTNDSIETLIEREFDALSPELQRAARWVRSNGPVLALRSMRTAAGQAGVSPATMTRLARRLGFESFVQPFFAVLRLGFALGLGQQRVEVVEGFAQFRMRIEKQFQGLFVSLFSRRHGLSL